MKPNNTYKSIEKRSKKMIIFSYVVFLLPTKCLLTIVCDDQLDSTTIETKNVVGKPTCNTLYVVFSILCSFGELILLQIGEMPLNDKDLTLSITGGN